MMGLGVEAPNYPPDTSRTVINLSGVPLEEAACSSLSKGLNYAVAPGRIPAKDSLCGVEKAIVNLPKETEEEIRQETVRILKGSSAQGQPHWCRTESSPVLKSQ
jgi:hypothetical protein